MTQPPSLCVAHLLLAAATTALACGCHKSLASEIPGPPPGEAWLTPPQIKESGIEVAVIDEQNVDDSLVTNGRVTFDDQRVAHVYSPVSGRVLRVDALLGAQVKKGTPLAALQSPDIGIASSDVGKARADLFAADRDFKRQQDLAENHAASQKAYLLHAGGGVNAGVSQGYILLAPMDGEITMKNVSPGAEVQGQYGSGTPVELFTVGDIRRIWVIADVFESDLSRVKVESKAVVRVVAQPGKELVGKVEWISATLDPSTRSAKVRCAFDNPDGTLKPEMYATAKISVEERKALAIHRRSLLRLGDQTVVFVQTGMTDDGKTKFERIPVAVDDIDGSEWIVVQHGLEKGAKVVTAGTMRLSSMM